MYNHRGKVPSKRQAGKEGSDKENKICLWRVMGTGIGGLDVEEEKKRGNRGKYEGTANTEGHLRNLLLQKLSKI